MLINAKEDRKRFVALLGGPERAKTAFQSLHAVLGHEPTLRNISICVRALEKDPAIVASVDGKKISASETEEGLAILNIVKVLGPAAAPKPIVAKPAAATIPTRTTPVAPAPAKPLTVAEKKEKASQLIREYQKLDSKARHAFVKENFALLEDPELRLSRTLLNFIQANRDLPAALRAGFGVTVKNAGQK